MFGIRGELRVHLHNREDSVLVAPTSVCLVTPSGSRQVRMRVRPGAGRRILAQVEGVDEPDAARTLIGARILARRADLPEPEAGSYYVHDLVGCRVFEGDVERGELTDVVAGGVDVWVVATAEGDAFVVAQRENVVTVDVLGRRVVVREGALTTG